MVKQYRPIYKAFAIGRAMVHHSNIGFIDGAKEDCEFCFDYYHNRLISVTAGRLDYFMPVLSVDEAVWMIRHHPLLKNRYQIKMLI